jgi:hypothetical protein
VKEDNEEMNDKVRGELEGYRREAISRRKVRRPRLMDERLNLLHHGVNKELGVKVSKLVRRRSLDQGWEYVLL